ncbi:MAG: hypothetical protein ACE5KX_05600 [Acidimicrobiia bacterium]
MDAIRTEILADADVDSPFGEAEATCVAESAVDEFGIEGLVELGITVDNANPENLFENATSEQVDAIVDITLNCVDFRRFFTEQMTAGAEISDESAKCLADGMLEAEFFRPLVAQGLRGEEAEFGDDPEAAAEVIELVIECLSPEELIQLGGGEEYPAQVVDQYIAGCVQEGGNQEFCQCTIDEFQDRMSVDEFLSAFEGATGAQPPEEFAEVIGACLGHLELGE